MKTTKTHPIVMLPTEKANLFLHSGTLLLNTKGDRETTEFVKPQHLYILSDEEIKEGDWVTDGIIKPFQLTRSHIELLEGTEEKDTCRKVIAATDKSLTLSIPESLDMYPMSYTAKSLPQIPESFTQVHIKAYNEGNPITEVNLEMEDIPNPKLKFDLLGTERIKTRPDNTVIIHPSKTYTKEEVEKLCSDAYRCGAKRQDLMYLNFYDWKKNNLK